MDNAYINTVTNNGIATIEFYHPKSNSFPSTQLNSLIKAIKVLGNDKDTKVIILKSKGEKVFCAGASFDELLTLNDKDKGKAFFMGFANAILTMRDCPKFIIGQIEGKVVGGGVGLAAACDYTLAMDNASIKLSELSIGIGPFVIEPAITRKIGVNAFSELTLNPKEWVSAEWCKSKGLYNNVYISTTELQNAVQDFAVQLSQYSPQAMKQLKSIMWENASNWDSIMQERAAMSGELVLSDFTKSTLKKFKSK